MAGESGERKRLPRRRRFSSGYKAKKTSGSFTESDRIPSSRSANYADRGGRKARRGKENNTGNAGKMEEEAEAACCGCTDSADPSLYFDEDSNHIFPVEQFFGNLDAVQDISHRSSGTEELSRRDRRRHYYAKEDSDEEPN